MIHKGKIKFPHPISEGRRIVLTAAMCAAVAWLTSYSVAPQDVVANPMHAAIVAAIAGAALTFTYGWAFKQRPQTTLLTRFFVMVSLCLPAVFLSSFGLALNEYGSEAVLRKNWIFDWPNYLADDILLALPAFVAGATVFLIFGAPPTPDIERPLGDTARDTLKCDWMRGFWIEPVLHANIGVIACVVMGTGALANRLALWLALYFLGASIFQLVLWLCWRVRRKIPPAWVCFVLIAPPFINWSRFPDLQEHGVEAIGGGIGMWTIALLATAVLSARRPWIALLALGMTTVAVAMAFYNHQHADGWFEQSTIAFLVGSFGLIVTLAAYDIYKKGTQNRHDLATALHGERLARQQAAVETERRRRILRAVGHDLRQPLSALQLWLYTSRKKEEEKDDNYNAAMASVSSAHEILDSIAQLSLVVDGEKQPRPSPLSLAPFLDDLRAEMLPLAESAGMNIRCRTISAVITTDAYLLRRIIRNFVVNAIRHANQGDILLCARRRNKGVEILVFDQGDGIDDALQSNIFQEFESSSQDKGGLGIGLVVARDLAEAMGLKVIFRSSPKKGSTFGVWIPQ